MSIVEDGTLNTPNPSLITDPDITSMIQAFNENFVKLNREGLGKRGAYTEIVLVNNANTPKTLVKTTKSSSVDFIATNAALTAKLPATGNLDGDRYMFADGSNNASTYNLTIDANGNLINGAIANLVININKGFILLEYINDNIGFKTISSNLGTFTVGQKYNTIASGTIDGANTVFTLTNAVLSGFANLIFLGGVPYTSSDFTIVGTTLTFTTPPPNGMVYNDFIILTWY